MSNIFRKVLMLTIRIYIDTIRIYIDTDKMLPFNNEDYGGDRFDLDWFMIKKIVRTNNISTVLV